MYITKIWLHNIRCFEDITIDLSSSEGAKRWVVMVGNNGVGKTSLLRSIAMGLCDSTGAASLLQDTYGDWIRKGQDAGFIEIGLDDGAKKHTIRTDISKSPADLEVISRKPELDETVPWKKIFICGYGANRSIEGDTSHERYSSADAVYSLFGYGYALQNPELMLLRRVRNSRSETEEEICGWLAAILMLEKGSVRLTDSGITITSYGHEIVWGSLADGYEATMTLVLDMLGWAMLAGIKKDKNYLSGIVLIDEIEQHLHPELQRRIIMNLSEVFPCIQFVASSHSPICAAGLADLPDEKGGLELLKRLDDGSVGCEHLPSMRGWRYDQVLTSEAFSTPARNVLTADFMGQIRELYMKEKLTKAEAGKLEKLWKELESQSSVGREAAERRHALDDLNRIRKELKWDTERNDQNEA